MSFRTDLKKSDIDAQLKDLSEQLKTIDYNERRLAVTLQKQLEDYLDSLPQVKEDKLLQIKKALASETAYQQKLLTIKFNGAIEATRSSRIKESLFKQLQDQLHECADNADKRYKQFVKQSELEIETSKETYLQEQQKKLNTQIAQDNINRDKIFNELRALFVSDEGNKLAAFKKELAIKVKEIDDTIAKSVKLINSSAFRIVLDEYKKIDVYLYNTTNELAQKHLMAKSEDLKLSLALRLAPLTAYNLSEALQLANKVVLDLSEQFTTKEKNKITFEHIARNIDKELDATSADPHAAHFEDVLLGIENECAKFSSRSEFLFTSLYYDKKRAYGNSLNSNASTELVDQDNARRLLQERALNYLLKHIDGNEFYLTFTNLGIEAMNSMIEGQTPESLETLQANHNQVLKQLHDKLDDTYNDFFTENGIADCVKEKLNHAEIKKICFQTLTQSYMKHAPEPIYKLAKHLTSAEVLSEIETDFERQQATVQDVDTTVSRQTGTELVSSKNKTDAETEFFINLFKKDNLPQFSYFIKIKKPSMDVINHVIARLSGEKASENYLKAIEEHQAIASTGNFGIFKTPVAKPACNTRVETAKPSYLRV